MALQKTVIDLPFVTGLGLAIDDRLAPNGAMQRLDNLHLSESGAALVRREAQVQIADGNNMSGSPVYPLVLHEHDDQQLICRSTDGVNTLAPLGSVWKWNQVGAIPDVGISPLVAYDNNGSSSNVDYAVQETGGMSVFASDGFFTFIDTATGAVRHQIASSATCKRCTRVGETLFLLERTSTTLTVKSASNFATPSIPLTTILNVTGLSTGTLITCDMVGAGTDSLAIADTHGLSVTVYFVPIIGGAFKSRTLSITGAVAGDLVQVAVGFDPARRYIFAASVLMKVGATAGFVYVLDSNTPGLTQVGATTTIPSPVPTSNAIRCGMTPICNPMVLAICYLPQFSATTAPASAGPGVFVYGEGDTVGTNISPMGLMLGKPFYMRPGEAVVPLAPLNGVGGGIQLKSVSRSWTIFSLGEVAVPLGVGPQNSAYRGQPVPSNYVQPDGSIDLGTSFNTATPVGATLNLERFRVVATAAGDTSEIRQAVDFAGLSVFSGASPVYFDGIATTNALSMSDAPTLKLKQIDAGAITPGIRQYTAIFEWNDANGRVYRTPPAVPITVDSTASGNHSLQLQYTLPHYVPVPKGIRLSVYSTTNLGTVFHKSTGDVFVESNIANGQGTPIVGVTMPDSALESQELLYTTGDILESYGMPPASCMTVHQHRLFVSNPDDNKIYYTLVDDGALGPSFNPLLVLDAGEETTTALASFDDKLIIFKRTAIYAIFGQGPDNAGNNANFSFVQLISSDTGCIDCRSVTLGAKGLYFQGLKGFYLLTPGLSVAAVGVDVERLSNGNVYSWAKTMPTENQIIFGRQSEQLVFDELIGQWSRFTSATGRLGEVWNDELALCPNDGSVFLQNDPLGLDNGSTLVPVTLETGWLKFAAIQGFERLWRILLLGAHQRAPLSDTTGTIAITYKVNYNETQTFTLADTTLPAGTDGTKWQLRYHMPHQKIEAVKFIVTYSAAGRSHVFSSMSFEVAGKIGAFKKPHAIAT